MIATLDIEAEHWTRFKTACLVTEYGEVSHFSSAAALDDAVRGLGRGAHVYAHRGGGFDFLFLMPLQSVVLSGGDVLRAQSGETWLHDSYALLPTSLQKIGEAVGLQKLPNRSDRMHELSLAEAEEHCQRDCEVLLRGVLSHRDWVVQVPHPRPGVPRTAGATALRCLEAYEPEVVQHLAKHPIGALDWRAHGQAVQGNRLESFCLGHRSPVYEYDRNGSYNAAWGEGPLPIGPFRRVQREVPGRYGFYFCEEIRQSRSTLPVVAPDGVWQYDGQDQWLTQEELDLLRLSGGDARVVHGWISEHTAHFGWRTVQALYPLKSAGRPWAKAVLSALHGKFCEGLEWETFYHDPGCGGWACYRADRELRLPTWHHRPLIAAAILARGRLALWRVAQELLDRDRRIYLLNTDSIHTDCPPQDFPAPLGVGVGQWRLEHGPVEALYLQPGLYGLRTPEGEPVKSVAVGGAPPGGVPWEVLERAAQGEPITLRWEAGLESFKGNSQAFRLAVAKHARSVHLHPGHKRVLAADWLGYQDQQG